MTHFNQGCADGHNLLAIDEYHTGFSLGSECNDGADGMALGEDWSVLIVSRPDGGRGGCRSDSNRPQHDCVLWDELDTLRHFQCGDTCC